MNQTRRLLQPVLAQIASLLDKDQISDACKLLAEIRERAKNESRYYQLLGFALGKVDKNEQAIQTLQHALELDNRAALTHTLLASLYSRKGDRRSAKLHLDQALDLEPLSFEARNNRAILYTEMHLWDQAAIDLAEALKVQPNSVSARVNLGNLHYHRRQFKAALKEYLAVLSIDNTNTLALYNAANIYQYFGNYPLTLQHLDAIHKLGTSPPFFLGMYIYVKLQLSEWSNLQQLSSQLISSFAANKQAARPLQIMAVLDRPDLERQAAVTYIRGKFPNLHRFPALNHEKISTRRIRVGYFSSDFCDHPVTYLMNRVFQCHDRNRFEIFAYSFNPKKPDAYSDQVKASVEHFVDVNQLSDADLISLCRNHRLDIAIDLNGLTKNCRTGIFVERVAPIQINYLGYLGTMGVESFDYIIADQVLIPPAERQHYAEKVLYLPIYQANDDALPEPNACLNRSDCGLPESAFVFCSFNNNYKITPGLFESWMHILATVSNSVLWLYVSNETAKMHLIQYATERGIDPQRLIFAGKVSLSEHIARQRLADLFLDTFPYNGGATTTAALRVGLPVLTLCGRSFSSRMGASLLTAVGVPTLIASTLQDYRDMAVRLATDPIFYESLRKTLAQNLETTDLYNPREFVANLEQGFVKILQINNMLPLT